MNNIYLKFQKYKLKNAIAKIKSRKIKNDIWLRAEAAILHVACKDVESAIKLLDTAMHSGFKRSGIISITESRVMLELISSERMDAIVSKDGKWLIDGKYLKVLIEECNNKLKGTRKKISKLYKLVYF